MKLEYSTEVGLLIAGLKDEGMSNGEIGAELKKRYSLSTTPSKWTINRYLKHFKRGRNTYEPDEEEDSDFYIEESTPFPEIETIYTEVNHKDIKRWQGHRDSLKDEGRDVLVATGHDIHFGDANFELLDLWYEWIYDVQPDVVNVGSDEHDYAAISKFPQTHRTMARGTVRNAVRYHERHIRNIRSCVPDVAIVNIPGNHDARMARYVMEHPEMSDDTIATMEENAAYGDAYFLGWEVDGFLLYSQNNRSLLVCHGHKTNINAAKSMWEDNPFDYICFGHIHRRNLWEKGYMVEGEWRNQWAISTGALCQMIPSYARNQRTTWQPGFALLRFNTKTGVASYDQIQPNERNEFYWGDKHYRPKKR